MCVCVCVCVLATKQTAHVAESKPLQQTARPASPMGKPSKQQGCEGRRCSFLIKSHNLGWSRKVGGTALSNSWRLHALHAVFSVDPSEEHMLVQLGCLEKDPVEICKNTFSTGCHIPHVVTLVELHDCMHFPKSERPPQCSALPRTLGPTTSGDGGADLGHAMRKLHGNPNHSSRQVQRVKYGFRSKAKGSACNDVVCQLSSFHCNSKRPRA